MGNVPSITCLFLETPSSSSSSLNNTQTKQEQIDIQWLGNNFPFGDDEIQVLYQVYNELLSQHEQQQQQQHQEQTASFLKDLAFYSYKFLYWQQIERRQKEQQKRQKAVGKTQKLSSSSSSPPPWANDEEESIAQKELLRLVLERRRHLLDVVEEEILPKQFSNRFYEAVFYDSPNDDDDGSHEQWRRWKMYESASVPTKDFVVVSESTRIDDNVVAGKNYCHPSVPWNENKDEMEQETKAHARKYLESFFRGLSVSCRRGPRAAMKALFMTCREVPSKKRNDHQQHFDSSSIAYGGGYNNYDGGSKQQQQQPQKPQQRRIRAIELVEMGYRLALATAFLQYKDDHDESDFFEIDKILGRSNSFDDRNVTKSLQQQTTHSSSQTKVDATATNDTSESCKTISTAINDNNCVLKDNVGRRQFLPTNKTIKDDTNSNVPIVLPPALEAFANSLLERARARAQRSGLALYNVSNNSDNNAEDDDGTVELDDVFDWLENVAPLFGSILSTFVQNIIQPTIVHLHLSTQQKGSTSNNQNSNSDSTPNVRSSFHMPSVPVGSSDFFRTTNSPELFILGCLSPSLSSSSQYHRLYTSTSDGLSFNRLLNAILGYSGPTLFIIRAVTKQTQGQARVESIFGAYTGSQWKESKDFYGNTDCFLYQLSPCTAVYRPCSSSANASGDSNNYMYCNSSARSRGYDQQAHGIGFGGTVHQPRLFLEESFENCVASSRDLTFENGHLLPQSTSQFFSSSSSSYGGQQQTQQNYFDIDALEVWGVGNSDVIDAGLRSRTMQRDVANEAIRRARKVDKAQFLDDLRSGVIDSKAFKHRTEIDGRADCDVDDRYNEQRRHR